MLLIQSILFFVLGAACACFFMLLLVPVIWRRALHLATKAVRMEIPLSLNEVEAEYDFARALHSVELCRMEEQVTTAKNKAMAARMALDMAQAQICYLAPFEEEADNLRHEITRMRDDMAQLNQENTAYRLKLKKVVAESQERQRIKVKIKGQKSIIRQLKRKISALSRQIIQVERQNDRLKDERHARQRAEQVNHEELTLLRQEMKQIASQLVAHIVHAQGEEGSVIPMLETSANPEGLASSLHQVIMTGNVTRSQEDVR